ncbi:hypothetical protein BDN71DRAFT_1503218 [Pleurotus eryngii]|uniref:Helicase C-terminal domain-containing protein n=1 Tax=Pleurotus eryngii TaxID=5323 RepID=A0A9P6A320_PLEER|nr:hypothetical protein BDN71DRAFT_1503218 [Pleurotus eryngii]
MTIQTVFQMKGISVLVLNGILTREQWDRIIEDFVDSDVQEHRVLLFSSVGAVRLNLTCADTVIMLDTIWLQVGTEQIIGWSVCLTQENAIHIYHLVSLGTTDVLMSAMACEKGKMLRMLFLKEKNDKLEQEDDNDDSRKKKKTKPLPSAHNARGPMKNAALKSISRLETPSTSWAFKTAAEETAEEPEVADDEGDGVDSVDREEEKMTEKGKGKGKEKARTKAPAKPKPAAKTKLKPRAKGKGKDVAEVNQEAAGPSKKPTGEWAMTSKANVDTPLGIVSEHVTSTARLPTEETGSVDMDKPTGAGPSLELQRMQPDGWIATQRESQSQSQTELMEIDNGLQRAFLPPMGTLDSPMDMDALADEGPKVCTCSTKSKGSKTLSSKAFDLSPPCGSP